MEPLTIGAMVLPSAIALGKELFGSRDPHAKQREQLVNQAFQRAQGSPFQSEGFRQGRSQLYDALSQQRGRDASNAAARGLSGGEFEIAQANQRGRRLSRGMSNLRREATNLQNRHFAQALQATGQERARADQREAAAWQGLGNAASSAAMAYYLRNNRNNNAGEDPSPNDPYRADVGVHRNF